MIEIVDFYAEWCHPCQVMKPVMHELEKELEGKANVKFINVDENQQESSKHGVMSIPTYVVLKDGKEIDRFIGVTAKQKFLDLVNN